MDRLNLLIAGVGGQGVVLAGDILADVAIEAGLDVKKTDTLGMAQRGGGVVTHLRIGQEIASPLISEGDADLLLAFEKLEAARWSGYLRQDSSVIMNDQRIAPLGVSRGEGSYPDDHEIIHLLRHRAADVMVVDASWLAAEAGNRKALNVLMLGALSMLLPFNPDSWMNAIKGHLPEKIQAVNLDAFARGRHAMLGLLSAMPGEAGHCEDDDCGCHH